ncbi:MAG: hypothetical protein OXF07_12735, partial [Rhodobacter sp.]|nr:hypothetical protein [Rhodobacter sp.]
HITRPEAVDNRFPTVRFRSNTDIDSAWHTEPPELRSGHAGFEGTGPVQAPNHFLRHAPVDMGYTLTA